MYVYICIYVYMKLSILIILAFGFTLFLFGRLSKLSFKHKTTYANNFFIDCVYLLPSGNLSKDKSDIYISSSTDFYQSLYID